MLLVLHLITKEIRRFSYRFFIYFLGEEEVDVTKIARRGRCKWFNVMKGWGFITPEDGGQEVFVHQVRLRFYKISRHFLLK